MERRVVLISERAFSTTVNGIERIESQSIPGIGLLQGLLPAGHGHRRRHRADHRRCRSTILRIMPPGMTPPNIIQFNASNVPVAQLTLVSDTLPEEQIFDYGLNFIRLRLFTIPGLVDAGAVRRQAAPDHRRRRSAGAQRQGAVAAGRGQRAAASNVILPAGTARIGNTRIQRRSSTRSPTRSTSSTSIPVKVVDGTPVLLGDVAKVSRRLRRPDQHRARQRPARHLSRHPQASRRLDAGRRRCARVTLLPAIQASGARRARAQDRLRPVGVRARRHQERAARGGDLVDPRVADDPASSSAAGAAWSSSARRSRSPSSSPIIGLKLTGNTLNIMTLGGLSLAIGMLVDDATVEVENIHRNRDAGQAADGRHPRRRAARSRCRRSWRRSPSASSSSRSCCSTGPAQVPVHAAGAGGRARDARVVPLRARWCRCLARMLMATEHHGEPGQDASGWTRFAHASTPARPAVRALSRARTAGCSATLLAASRLRGRRSRRCVALASLGAGHGRRHRLLPDGRRRPDEAALARAAGTRIEETEQAAWPRSRSASAASSPQPSSRRSTT